MFIIFSYTRRKCNKHVWLVNIYPESTRKNVNFHFTFYSTYGRSVVDWFQLFFLEAGFILATASWTATTTTTILYALTLTLCSKTDHDFFCWWRVCVRGHGGTLASKCFKNTNNYCCCCCAALAWFRLSTACCFIVLGTYALVRFYRSRWILDIRTRWANWILW